MWQAGHPLEMTFPVLEPLFEKRACLDVEALGLGAVAALLVRRAQTQQASARSQRLLSPGAASSPGVAD